MRAEADAEAFARAESIRSERVEGRDTLSERALEPNFCAATGVAPIWSPWTLAEGCDVRTPSRIAAAAEVISGRSGAEAPVAGGASADTSMLRERSDSPALTAPGFGLFSADAVAAGCAGWDSTGSVASPVPSSSAAG